MQFQIVPWLPSMLSLSSTWLKSDVLCKDDIMILHCFAVVVDCYIEEVLTCFIMIISLSSVTNGFLWDISNYLKSSQLILWYAIIAEPPNNWWRWCFSGFSWIHHVLISFGIGEFPLRFKTIGLFLTFDMMVTSLLYIQFSILN